MNKKVMLVILVVMFLITTFIPVTGAGNKGQSIRNKLSKMGFGVGAISAGKGGVYTVQVTAFKPKSKGITRTTPFSPFTIRAKVGKGKVFLDLPALKRNNYQIQKIGLGNQVMFSASFDKFLRELNSGKNQLNRILDSVKKLKQKASVKISEARRKVRLVQDLMDNCLISANRLIPLFRQKFRSLGLTTGKIFRDKRGIFRIEVLGVTGTTKIKLKTGNIKPYVLGAVIKKGTLQINRMAWAKVVLESGRGFPDGLAELIDPSPPSLPSFGVPNCGGDNSFNTCLKNCDCHIGNARTALANARGFLKCLENAIKEIERMRGYIADRCQGDFPLSELDKTALVNVLARLEVFAERHREGYDRYIADVESFIASYNECKENESLPVTFTF